MSRVNQCLCLALGLLGDVQEEVLDAQMEELYLMDKKYKETCGDYESELSIANEAVGYLEKKVQRLEVECEVYKNQYNSLLMQLIPRKES